MVIFTLLILGLKYWGKLPLYLCLPHWANVLKLFNKVIYSHSMVFTAIMMFYNIGWQQYHQMGVNYHGKKFYNISPMWNKLIVSVNNFYFYIYLLHWSIIFQFTCFLFQSGIFNSLLINFNLSLHLAVTALYFYSICYIILFHLGLQ